MERSRASSAIEGGRALFNAARYFEAHEVWEQAWLASGGARRVLLQGLIQIAAALHKAKRVESPGGSLRLLDAGRSKLESVAASEWAGLALDDFLAALAGLRVELDRWRRTETPLVTPSAYPQLKRSA
jgi:predicted metal-dependent hydrolase